MPNHAAVALLTDRFATGRLTHPGDPDNDKPPALIVLPSLATTGVPDQMAHFAAEAGLPSHDAPQLIAEAVVHTLEIDGELELVNRAELGRLRAEAARVDNQDPTHMISVYSHANRIDPVMVIAADRAAVFIDAAALRQRLDEVCP